VPSVRVELSVVDGRAVNLVVRDAEVVVQGVRVAAE
jgi:hypothetical protein